MTSLCQFSQESAFVSIFFGIILFLFKCCLSSINLAMIVEQFVMLVVVSSIELNFHLISLTLQNSLMDVISISAFGQCIFIID